MILGVTRPGPTAAALGTGKVFLLEETLTLEQRFASLAMYVDGSGPGDGPGYLRGVFYRASDRVLLGVGPVVAVARFAPAQWVDLPIPSLQGAALPAGDYGFGAFVGGTNTALRAYRHTSVSPGSVNFPDVWATGPTSPSPAWASQTFDMPFIATVFDAWRAPHVEEIELARLPWEASQRALGETGTLPRTAATARCGWHSTAFAPETGAVAVVRSDGPLADRVGERLAIARPVAGRMRTAYVYVYDELDFPAEIADEDVSLSRRAFAALGAWWEDSIAVQVTTLA